jgi:hypothetical protein
MSYIVDFISIIAPFKNYHIPDGIGLYTKGVKTYVDEYLEQLGMHNVQYRLLVVEVDVNRDISDALQSEILSYSLEFYNERDAFIYKLKNKYSKAELEHRYVNWYMRRTNPCNEITLHKAQTCVLGETI